MTRKQVKVSWTPGMPEVRSRNIQYGISPVKSPWIRVIYRSNMKLEFSLKRGFLSYAFARTQNT